LCTPAIKRNILFGGIKGDVTLIKKDLKEIGWDGCGLDTSGSV